MANVLAIKEFLSEDKERIIDLLDHIGCSKIKYYPSSNEIRCAETEDGNPTAIRIKCDTLLYKNYVDNKKGDIFSLIENIHGCNFSESLCFVQKHFKLEYIETQEKRLPFNAFYKKLLKHTNKFDSEIQTYDNSIMQNIINICNKRFLADGISCDVQKEFNIGYDIETERITIPWYTSEGELMGIMGRINLDEFDDSISKYLAIIPFQKTMSLYGFSHNYFDMIGNTVWIVESEKSVLQAKSMGIRNVVAVGCHSVSAHQIKLIRSLYPKNIIIAFDEGIKSDDILLECNKFITNNYFQYKVGYFNNKILEIGKKQSPFDLGIACKELLRENIKWAEN